MRDLRVAIIAISDAAKKPFAKIKINMSAASHQRFSKFIGVRLLFLYGSRTEENAGDVFSVTKQF